VVAAGDRRMNEVEAREQLAAWLAEHSATPEECTVEALESWDTQQVDEWLMFDPPGFANRLFLVADDNVFDFAPSEQSLPEALAAARNIRAWESTTRDNTPA